MMSFSKQVKEEIVFNDFEPCCKKALMLALLKINGSIRIASTGMTMTLRTENAKIASKAHRLLKDLYACDIEFLVQKKIKLKKNNVYIVRIHKAREILDDLKLMNGSLPEATLLQKECCRRAYLAGCFLASGSVNDPQTSNYHLEVACQDEALAEYICSLMNSFNLHAKTIERRSKQVIYIKSAEKISDFLRIVGSSQAVMEFENKRIERDFSNNINRWDNCVIANEMKSVAAGASQVEDIRLLLQNYAFYDLDEKTQMIAQIRLENPDVSLQELANIYTKTSGLPISKSGINHQLTKIKQHAAKIRSVSGSGDDDDD